MGRWTAGNLFSQPWIGHSLERETYREETGLVRILLFVSYSSVLPDFFFFFWACGIFVIYKNFIHEYKEVLSISGLLLFWKEDYKCKMEVHSSSGLMASTGDCQVGFLGAWKLACATWCWSWKASTRWWFVSFLFRFFNNKSLVIQPQLRLKMNPSLIVFISK